MKDGKLLQRLASYATAYDFTSMLNILPDPDPILRKRGADISIYRDLPGDSHLFACMQSRTAGTLRRPWQIALPAGADDNARSRQVLEFVVAVFRRLDTDRITAEMLDALFWGYTPFEYIWRAEGDKVVYEDIAGLPPEWFAWTPDGEPRFLTKHAPLEGEEIDERKFLFVRHRPSYDNPYGERIFSKVFWPIVFKKGTLKFWFIYTEKYGMPWALIKHPRSAGEDEIANLLSMAVRMVQDGVAAIPDDDSIQLVDTPFRASSAGIYEKLKDSCNFEISKAVLGQTLTTEIGDTGSRAAATVHLIVRDDLIEGDHRLVEAGFDRAIRRLVLENFDFDGPFPEFHIIEEDLPADENERANIDLGWRMGILGEDHARKRLHIPAPAGDDKTIAAPQQGMSFAEKPGVRRRRPKYPAHIENAARPAADAAYEGLADAVKAAVRKCRSYEDLPGLNLRAAFETTRTLGDVYHGVILHGYLQGRADVADDMRSLAGQESFADAEGTDFVTPEAAVKYFQNKVPLSPEEYERLSSNMRHYAFTMAGVERNDLLSGVHKEAARAMAEGRTFAEFKADVDAAFDRLGVTRANDFHLETVFVNNLSEAYNAGLYDELHGEVAERLFPNLRYKTMEDGVVRPAHAAIANVTLPRDDPWWTSNWPKNGHRCRCWVEGVTAEEARGLRIYKGSDLPSGFDPGFDGSPRAFWDKPYLYQKELREWDQAQLLASRENKLLAAIYESAAPRLARQAWVKNDVKLLPAGKPAAYYAGEMRQAFGTPRGLVRTTDALGDYVTFMPESVAAHYAGGPDASRLRLVPLIKTTLEEPYEVWLEAYFAGGRAVWRKNYVYLYRNDPGSRYAAVVRTGHGDGLLLESIPATDDALRLHRRGVLLHRRQ